MRHQRGDGSRCGGGAACVTGAVRTGPLVAGRFRGLKLANSASLSRSRSVVGFMDDSSADWKVGVPPRLARAWPPLGRYPELGWGGEMSLYEMVDGEYQPRTLSSGGLAGVGSLAAV